MTDATDFAKRYQEIRSIDYLIDYVVGELDRLGRLQNNPNEIVAAVAAKEYHEWGERCHYLYEQKRLKVEMLLDSMGFELAEENSVRRSLGAKRPTTKQG